MNQFEKEYSYKALVEHNVIPKIPKGLPFAISKKSLLRARNTICCVQLLCELVKHGLDEDDVKWWLKMVNIEDYEVEFMLAKKGLERAVATRKQSIAGCFKNRKFGIARNHSSIVVIVFFNETDCIYFVKNHYIEWEILWAYACTQKVSSKSNTCRIYCHTTLAWKYAEVSQIKTKGFFKNTLSLEPEGYKQIIVRSPRNGIRYPEVWEYIDGNCFINASPKVTLSKKMPQRMINWIISDFSIASKIDYVKGIVINAKMDIDVIVDHINHLADFATKKCPLIINLKNYDHVLILHERILEKHRECVGFCLDMCRLFVSGLDSVEVIMFLREKEINISGLKLNNSLSCFASDIYNQSCIEEGFIPEEYIKRAITICKVYQIPLIY